ncbi:MAG: hypothetical protein DWH95_08955 [Planctomycetota bacterium]|nr:MAG: hypothetical protein DWH95_08955 [Planctomycetota bacterium]
MAVSEAEGDPNPCSKRLICCFKCEANNSPKALLSNGLLLFIMFLKYSKVPNGYTLRTAITILLAL